MIIRKTNKEINIIQRPVISNVPQPPPEPLKPITIRYAMVPASKIFGMVGRCGGGYNTVWQDWTEDGRRARELIMKEFEEELDKKCGHYKRLEESMLAEGMRNPLIITCGLPLIRKIHHLPPELRTRPNSTLLLLEGTTGGSRLWIAQKYNMVVPCLINDRTGAFKDEILVKNAKDATQYYKDEVSLGFAPHRGLYELHNRYKKMYHLESNWHDSVLMDEIRAPIWYKAMKRHGYSIPLTPTFKQLLQKAGINV